MVRVFANGLGDLGSIPGRVLPKTKKWYLMPTCLAISMIKYGSRVKWVNPGKGVAPSPTYRCSSYRKGGLRVTLDYGRQLYLLYFYPIRIILKQFNLAHRWFSNVYYYYSKEFFHGAVVNVLDCDSEFKSSHAITFTFRLIPLGKL